MTGLCIKQKKVHHEVKLNGKKYIFECVKIISKNRGFLCRTAVFMVYCIQIERSSYFYIGFN